MPEIKRFRMLVVEQSERQADSFTCYVPRRAIT